MTKFLPEVIGVIAFSALGIRILTPLVTMSLPLRLAARMCLRSELRKNRIGRLIPRVCITEIADAACSSQTHLAVERNWSPLLIKDRIATEMQRDALAIRDWLHGVSVADMSAYLTVVLRKHRIPFGLLAIAAEEECGRVDSGATG